MKKQSLKIYALILSLLMLLTALVVLPASADNSSATDPDPNLPDGWDTDVYYITDSNNPSNIWNYLQTRVDEAYMFNISNQEVFWNAMNESSLDFTKAGQTALVDVTFSQIRNSLIIFEVSKGFRANVPGDPDGLHTLFSDIKGCTTDEHPSPDPDNNPNNNKILFICNTDEVRILGHNAFLDHVDLHANTDLLSFFGFNVIFHAINTASLVSGSFENCTFIFSQSCLNDPAFPSPELEDNWFFMQFFVPYFKWIYEDEIRNQGFSFYEMLEDKNIQILIHAGGATFMDCRNPGSYNWEEDDIFVDNYLVERSVFAIGTTLGGNTTYENGWVSQVVDMWEHFGAPSENAGIYMFNPTATVFDAVSSNSIPFYQCGTLLNSFPTVVREMIDKLLSENDIFGYDNWPGRCNITYKPVAYGPNGWMIGWDELFVSETIDYLASGESNDLPPFISLYMSASDRDYYNSIN